MKNIRGEAVLHYIFDTDICFSCRALSCALLTMTSTYWTTPSSYTGILTDPATNSFHFGKRIQFWIWKEKCISDFRQIYIDNIITDLVSKQRRLFLLTQKRSLRKIISSTMRFSPRSPQIIQTWQLFIRKQYIFCNFLQIKKLYGERKGCAPQVWTWPSSTLFASKSGAVHILRQPKWGDL